VDNTFNIPPSYATALCDRIIERNLNLSWRCIVYPWKIDEELAEKMAALGRAWTDLAEALKAASERQEPDFSEAAEKLDVLLDMSRRYHNKAASLGG